jgi:hypothetical protein
MLEEITLGSYLEFLTPLFKEQLVYAREAKVAHDRLNYSPLLRLGLTYRDFCREPNAQLFCLVLDYGASFLSCMQPELAKPNKP